jgi:hypothetical protein
LKVTLAFAMRRYAGFCSKREPALCGRRTPFFGVVISNITASPPLNLYQSEIQQQRRS